MTLEQAQQAFAALPATGQSRLLATLAFDLTIWARTAYPEVLTDSDQIIAGLRCNDFSTE